MNELWIESKGREFEVTKDRTELYRYLGEKAIFDHIDINGVPSFKIFRHHPDYELAVEYCEANDYPQAINQVHVTDTVIWRYQRSLEQEDVERVYLKEAYAAA